MVINAISEDLIDAADDFQTYSTVQHRDIAKLKLAAEADGVKCVVMLCLHQV